MSSTRIAIWQNNMKAPGTLQPDGRGHIEISLALVQELVTAWQQGQHITTNQKGEPVFRLNLSAWRSNGQNPQAPMISGSVDTLAATVERQQARQQQQNGQNGGGLWGAPTPQPQQAAPQAPPQAYQQAAAAPAAPPAAPPVSPPAPPAPPAAPLQAAPQVPAAAPPAPPAAPAFGLPQGF